VRRRGGQQNRAAANQNRRHRGTRNWHKSHKDSYRGK
jgi:hypothetical protein